MIRIETWSHSVRSRIFQNWHWATMGVVRWALHMHSWSAHQGTVELTLRMNIGADPYIYIYIHMFLSFYIHSSICVHMNANWFLKWWETCGRELVFWKSGSRDQHDGQYADVDVHSLVFMVLFCVSDGDVWRKRSLDFLPTTYYYLYIVYAEVNFRRRTWWLEAKDAHTRFFHGDIIWANL